MLYKFKNLSGYLVLILVIFVLFFNGSFGLKMENESVLNIANLLDTFIIPANPGPSNNGGSSGWAIFYDLIAGSRNVTVTQMSSGNAGTANATFNVEVYTRSGTGLGGPVSIGPGSSSAGWTLLGTVPAVQGSTTNGISLVFAIPPINVDAYDTVGVAVKFLDIGPRYYGTGSPPLSVYSDTNLTLITGDVRSAPFTPTGSWFSSRALTGEIRYVISPATYIGKIGTEAPAEFKLRQNYPNPFNPITKINYDIAKTGFVSLKVYDILGDEVAVLVNEMMNPGLYIIDFNASNLSSGTYFYRLEVNGFVDTKKMIVLK